MDWLLKGPEYNLGDGTLFVDKEGFARASVRAKWWIPIRPGMNHAEAAMPAGEIRGEGRVPDDVSYPGYDKEEPVVFFGTIGCLPRLLGLLWLQTSCAWTFAGYGGPRCERSSDYRQSKKRDCVFQKTESLVLLFCSIAPDYPNWAASRPNANEGFVAHSS